MNTTDPPTLGVYRGGCNGYRKSGRLKSKEPAAFAACSAAAGNIWKRRNDLIIH